jgi:DNA polymerase, archaea type
MEKLQGMLLDIDYQTHTHSEIVVYVKTGDGIQAFVDKSFHPYFWVTAEDTVKAHATLEKSSFGEGARIREIETVDKAGVEALKISFDKVEHLTKIREDVKELSPKMERYEYDIPFSVRYTVDKQLQPMGKVELEVDGNEIRSIKGIPGETEPVRMGCFDIETTSEVGKFSDPKKDSSIMLALAGEQDTIVWSFKKIDEPFVEHVKTEKEEIDRFVQEVKKQKFDVLVTYNGDMFDFPFLKERSQLLGTKLALGIDGSEPRGRKKGMDTAVKVKGIQHLDAYQMLRLLSRLGVVSLIKFDLESVIERLYGEAKEKVLPQEINDAWATGKGLERVARYNRDDVDSTLRIARQYLPLVIALSKLVKRTVFDISRASASMLVEDLLVDRSFKQNKLVANRPKEFEVKQRMTQSYAGGYVKEPLPGLHENIAVLDFSSLHPTIMITHNISPETLLKEKTNNCSPNGHSFSLEKEGFISGELKGLYTSRMIIKNQLKTMDKQDPQYTGLYAEQQALKIIMNSFYGYLGYPRSRGYSIECASSVTAWSREYVQQVAEKGEADGFTVIYGDTDSCFLKMPKTKTKEDVRAFVKKVNTELPGVMELELEGFFKRGIFVTKESGEGAKKKYALIDEKNNLKIVGFEYVRRDWSGVAKDTQKGVIEAILEDGNPEKAAQIVQETIKQLKEGTMPKEKLVILTKIQRSLSSYDSIGPHVAAAQKAVKRGKKVGAGSVIGYIVTRAGKSISDKAELEEYVEHGNYDAGYYINNQVLPAVLRIMRELGYSKEDLEHGGKQQTLFG